MECGGMTPLSSTRRVASNQSADMSAHSKSAFRIPPGQRVASRMARRTGTLFLYSFWDGRSGQLAFELPVSQLNDVISIPVTG
jgi:hypothetical protein